MTDFSPLTALLGGVFIGLAAGALLLLDGRIAGISGIFAGLLRQQKTEIGWQAAFVVGLVAGGTLMAVARPEWFRFGIERSWGAIAAAGLLVGFGTRLGNGCTSGHGVCGLSRFSRRSLVATMTFMVTGALAVLVVHRLFGGSL